MWENLALGTFGDLVGLPEILVNAESFGVSDSAPLDWVMLLHPGEAVPPIHNVVECQEYISKIGFDAQLSLLMSPDGAAPVEVERIGRIVTLANQEILYHDAFLDKETGGPKLHKFAEEIRNSIKMEVLRALNKGSVYES